MTKNSDQLEDTKRLMAALGRMKPKQHKEMKVGNKNKAQSKKKAKTKPGR
jgi:hypothetical protein